MKQKSNEASYPEGRTPIRPELLAAKLSSVQNYEYPELADQMTANPRLVETFWFLQKMSLLPGGLLKFVEEFLAEFLERLGTPTMLAAKSDNYTLAEKVAIYFEIPSGYRPYIKLGRDNVYGVVLSAMTAEEVAKMDASDRRAVESAVKEMDAEFFGAICRRAALEQLPKYFTALCTEKGREVGEVVGWQHSAEALAASYDDWNGDERVGRFLARKAETAPQPIPAGSAWYFQDIMGTLVQFMDRWAAKVEKRMGRTEVITKMYDACDFAEKEKRPVHVWGNSRFGKSEGARLKAEMYPGRWRYFEVPSDNCMDSLLKRLAECVGIDCSYGSNTSHLKERVLYVLDNCGLNFFVDQAQWLVTKNAGPLTAPTRLNWVQSEMMERRIPFVMISTTEARRDKRGGYMKDQEGNLMMEDMFKSALERFRIKTGYCAEQFNGRIYKRVPLPEKLSEADLVAAARIHFPAYVSDKTLGYIANEARLSENYLQAVDAIACNARHFARRHGGKITHADIFAAVSEGLSRNPTIAEQGTGSAHVDVQEASPMVTRTAAGRRVNEPLKPVASGLQPAGMDTASNRLLDSSVLHGAGPERVERDLVPVEA